MYKCTFYILTNLERIERRMTPAAHTSTATVCFLTLRRTSGGLKPGVPARGASLRGRARHVVQVVRLRGHVQDT